MGQSSSKPSGNNRFSPVQSVDSQRARDIFLIMHARTFLSGILLLTLPMTALADAWHRWRGPNADGLSPEALPGSGSWPEADLPRLWKTNVGTGFSSPVIQEGRLFVSGNQHDRDTFYCIDVKTGKSIWKHRYDSELWPYLYDGGPNATATIDGDHVYVLGRHGECFCFQAADGKKVWEVNLHQGLKLEKPSWGFTSAPLVLGETLYLNAGTRGLALEKATGNVVWTSGSGDAAYPTPEPVQFGDIGALIIFGPESCSAVRSSDGKLLWETPWKTKYKVNAAQPIIRDGKMFLSSAYGFGCALFSINTQGAKEIWRNKAMENHFNSCVLLGDHLYGISGTTADKCMLKCLSWQTGETLWEEKGMGMGSIIATKDLLIVLSDRGELVFAPASPKRFQPVYRTQILGGKCWTPPAIADGHLYARNAKGDLVAVKLP